MAKKLSLDFSRNTPTWAADLRRQYVSRQNAEAQIDAAIQEIVSQDDVVITEEQRNKAVDDLLRTGSFDFTGKSVEEVFPTAAPVLPSKAPVQTEEEGFLPRAVKDVYGKVENIYSQIPVVGKARESFLAGAGGIARDLMFRDVDAAAAEQVRKAKEEQRIKESSLPEPLARILYTDIVSPLVAKAGEAVGGNQEYRKVFGSLSKYVDTTRKSLDEQLAGNVEESPILGRAERAIVDVAGSPQSLASIPGGAFAAIPAATTYNEAYRKAREAGLDPDEAAAYATNQMAIEGGISALPAGKVGRVLLGGGKKAAGKGLADVIESRAARTIKTGIGESVEEMAQTGAADAVDRLTSLFAEDEKTQKFAEGQISTDLLAETERAGLAGLFGGVGAGAPHVALQHAAEAGKQAAETEGAALEASRGVMRPSMRKAAEEQTDVDAELVKELQKDAAFKQRQEEQKLADEQKALEEEAAFRTMEAEREFAGKTRLETYGDGVTERTPINPPAETTPEQVAAEKEAAEKAEAERKERVELGGLTEDIRKQREKAAKETEKKQKTEAKKQKAAETKRRNDLARQIALENPDVSPDELAPLLREKLAQPAAPATETKTASKPKRFAKPKTTDKNMGDAEVTDLASRLGLGMQEAAGENDPAVDRPAFERKVGDIVRTLVKKNRQDTADVQNLIRQGKLVLVPNAESAGLDPTDDVAQYVPEDGRMYLFTDKVDGKNAPAIMARALHEATHAGQFNDRVGRPSVLKQMMTPSAENKASKAILKAAESGNKMAATALKKAQAASPDTAVQDLELVPYFVTEAAQARGTTLGSLRGVGKDVLSSARNFVREKLGVDLDLSMSDLDTASHKVAGEVVKTKVKPRKGNVLSMIAGPKSKDFDKARKEGLTYQGFVDRKMRYEIPDVKAELKDSGVQALESGSTISLDELLDHPQLLDNYPQLKKIKVKTGESLVGDAQYQSDSKLIQVHPLHVAKASFGAADLEELRNMILHETQHAVQDIEGFVAGANTQYLIPRETSKRMQRTLRTYNDYVDEFPLEEAIKELDAEEKAEWERHVDAYDLVTRNAKSKHFTELFFLPSGSKNAQLKQAAADVENSRSEYELAKAEFNKAENKAFRDYLRDYGEAEARNTELRSRTAPDLAKFIMPEETLATDPLSKQHDVRKDNLLDAFKEVQTKGHIASSTKKPMGMAETAEAANVNSPKRYAPAWFTGLFRSDVGLGKQINEIVEYARSSPAGVRMQAEAHLERYGKALNSLAKQRGITPDALAKEIEDKLNALDKKSDSYEQNRENFVQVASQYGDAGKNLIALRDSIDDLSLGILRQRAAEGTPLSEAEKKLYKTMLSNLGRYAHRTYAANTGKIGDSYAKDVWKSFEKANKGKKLSEDDIENASKVERAISYLVDNELNIPEDEELSNISADKARALYSTWVGPRNVDSIPVEQVKAELADIRDTINGDKKRLKNQAEATARELLGLTDTTGPLVKYYRGAKQDTGILKERENIPEELRELMGEIKDPAAKLMITVGKQAEFVARNKMMLELRNQIGLDIQPPSAAGTDAVKGMTQLEGEQYGPMEGYYVSPNMRAFIGDTMQQLVTFEQAVAMANHKPQELPKRVLNAMFDKWAGVASFSKAMSVIGNPVRFIYNYIGAYRQLVSNGNLNPKYWLEGHKAMIDVLANAIKPSFVSDRLKDANTYGVTDSAFIGEIKSEEYRKLSEVIKKMSGKSPSKFMAGLKKAKVGYKETYAMMDVWSKLANFYHQVDVLTEFHKANGDKVTEEQIKREAADKVNRTNITYKRAAPLIKGMERGGVTQFGTYFAEVFRSEIGNALQGVDEYRQALNAKTPEARNIMLGQATKRIGGQITSWTLAAYATRALARMTFGDDEEKEKKLRALLPEYLRNQDFVNMGKDENGKDVLFNISQLDPIGPATDIMRSMLNGEASPEELQKSIFDLYIAPRIGAQLVTAAGTMFSDSIRPPKRKTTLQEVAPGVYSDLLKASPLEDRQDKAWLNVAESFAPGWIKAARSENAHPEGATDAMTYMGATLYRLEPEKQAKYAAMDYSAALKDSRKDVAEYFGNHPEYAKEELIDMLVEQREAEKKAFDAARKVYEGMVASGMSPRKASAILKAERLSADAIKHIRRGDFNSQVVSKESITQFMKQEIAAVKTLAEKKEVKRKWNEAWKLLKAADRDIDKEEQ